MALEPAFLPLVAFAIFVSVSKAKDDAANYELMVDSQVEGKRIGLEATSDSEVPHRSVALR